MPDTFVTALTIACQVPLSMGFPRQEYWSELSFPSPGDLSNPEVEPTSPELVGRLFTTEPPGKPHAVLVTAKKNSHSSPAGPCSVRLRTTYFCFNSQLDSFLSLIIRYWDNCCITLNTGSLSLRWVLQ